MLIVSNFTPSHLKILSTYDIGIGVNNITVNGIPAYITNLVIISNLDTPQNGKHSVFPDFKCFCIRCSLSSISFRIPITFPIKKYTIFLLKTYFQITKHGKPTINLTNKILNVLFVKLYTKPNPKYWIYQSDTSNPNITPINATESSKHGHSSMGLT